MALFKGKNLVFAIQRFCAIYLFNYMQCQGVWISVMSPIFVRILGKREGTSAPIGAWQFTI